MTDTRSTPWLAIVIVLALLPALYVLSVGPANYLFETGVISEKTLLSVYAPIHWLAQYSEVFESIISWYCWIWTATRSPGTA
jgi:hypothetical protein